VARVFSMTGVQRELCLSYGMTGRLSSLKEPQSSSADGAIDRDLGWDGLPAKSERTMCVCWRNFPGSRENSINHGDGRHAF